MSTSLGALLMDLASDGMYQIDDGADFWDPDCLLDTFAETDEGDRTLGFPVSCLLDPVTTEEVELPTRVGAISLIGPDGYLVSPPAFRIVQISR